MELLDVIQRRRSVHTCNRRAHNGYSAVKAPAGWPAGANTDAQDAVREVLNSSEQHKIIGILAPGILDKQPQRHILESTALAKAHHWGNG